MARKEAWAGWIAFAGILAWTIGIIDIFQGLIAVIRDKYYVFTPSQIIVFDVTTWGWITLIWGVVLLLVGTGLFALQGWARWVGIIVMVVTIVEQLGWLGSSAYPLWSLTVLSLSIVVLYALTVRWKDVEQVM